MRDVIVSLIIVGLLPTCYRRPFAGLALFFFEVDLLDLGSELIARQSWEHDCRWWVGGGFLFDISSSGATDSSVVCLSLG